MNVYLDCVSEFVIEVSQRLVRILRTWHDNVVKETKCTHFFNTQIGSGTSGETREEEQMDMLAGLDNKEQRMGRGIWSWPGWKVWYPDKNTKPKNTNKNTTHQYSIIKMTTTNHQPRSSFQSPGGTAGIGCHSPAGTTWLCKFWSKLIIIRMSRRP